MRIQKRISRQPHGERRRMSRAHAAPGIKAPPADDAVAGGPSKTSTTTSQTPRPAGMCREVSGNTLSRHRLPYRRCHTCGHGGDSLAVQRESHTATQATACSTVLTFQDCLTGSGSCEFEVAHRGDASQWMMFSRMLRMQSL